MKFRHFKYYMNFKYLIIISTSVLVIYSCQNESNKPAKDDFQEISFEQAQEELPLYANFLQHFKDRGYTFWDFHTYIQADKSALPEKLIVLRHDVHHRDIPSAYRAKVLEENIIGFQSATYYVMLDFYPETLEKDYDDKRADYLNFMHYLKSEAVDVQPHTSPWDDYLAAYPHTWWIDLSEDSLKAIKNTYYSITQNTEFYQITPKSIDTLGINHVLSVLPGLIESYNIMWENELGLKVETVAAHGSSTPINHVINNVPLLNVEQVRNVNLFVLETSSPEVFQKIKFIHDNNRPLWIENPEQIEDGQYELLMHPQVWENPQEYRDLYWPKSKSNEY
ncbi:MAG: hypothetical protein JW729_11105 [Bacteroidales bacterium]|nr:hypothetical protein [Bacteroidales bacterium]